MGIFTTTPTVSIHELKEKIDKKEDICILDVRDKSELSYGSIANHLFIPTPEIESRIDEIPKKEIIVYCKMGGRSRRVTKLLVSKGFNAKNLEGGIIAWKEIDPSIQNY